MPRVTDPERLAVIIVKKFTADAVRAVRATSDEYINAEGISKEESVAVKNHLKTVIAAIKGALPE